MAHQSDHIIEPAESLISDTAAARSTGGESVLGLVTTLAHGKKTIAKFTIVGTLLAVVISLILPIRYTGTTAILPPQQNQSSLANLMEGQMGMLAGLGKDLGLKSGVDLYTAMLSSESVQDGVIRRFKLMDLYHEKTMTDARKTLEARTTVTPSMKQGLIRLSVEDSDPKRAADLANGYIEELRALNQRIANGESSERRVFFENQLRGVKDNLTAAEQKMRETQERTGVLQLDAQSRGIIQTVASLRAQIAGKEVQLQAMRSFATGENPDYVIAGQQLAGLRVQLAKVMHSQNSPEGDSELPTNKVPEAGLAYLRAYRELRYQEAVYEIIARQYEGAKLDEAKSTAFVQVIDPATVPEKKSFPKRTMITICGFLAAFVLSCVFVTARESYRRFVADPINREQVDLLKTHLQSPFVK
jgi:tyrosine-protein kinase Etk/Wzc